VSAALRVRAAVALVLMMLAGIGSQLWRPTHYMADAKAKLELEQVFPAQFGTWALDTRGPVQLVSPDQQALLKKLYGQTLSRTYTNPQGDRVMLSVAYGGDQSDATTAHRPDVCYPAQGFDILARGSSVVQLGGAQLPTLHMLARLGARVEPVSYWFVVGEHVALSGTDQKLAQLRYSARGIVPDGLLMRVSTIDTDAPHAYTVHSAFVTDLFAAIQPPWRERVFGAMPTAPGKVSSAAGALPG
jgi:EpsI family protein